MPLAPEIEAMLKTINLQPPMHQTPIAELRKTRERIGATDFQPVGSVVDDAIPGPGGPIPVRRYAPERQEAALPLVVFFHGGGFVFGSVDGYYDHVCRVICSRANCEVVSVAYRLAPEHKFPAAVDDGVAAVQWAFEHGSRIIVAGGSAGANLAAATALRVRDAGGAALRGQVLFYPLTDYHTPPTPSSLAYANGYYLTRADVVWFWNQYLRSEDEAHSPYAAPLRAATLAGLPPALIITAEYDPLRDEGERYAQRLRDEGVPLTLSRYAGMIHGFMAFPTPKASTALQEGAAWIRRNI